MNCTSGRRRPPRPRTGRRACIAGPAGPTCGQLRRGRAGWAGSCPRSARDGQPWSRTGRSRANRRRRCRRWPPRSATARSRASSCSGSTCTAWPNGCAPGCTCSARNWTWTTGTRPRWAARPAPCGAWAARSMRCWRGASPCSTGRWSAAYRRATARAGWRRTRTARPFRRRPCAPTGSPPPPPFPSPAGTGARAPQGLHMLFVGSLDYPPNQEAALLLAGRLAPCCASGCRARGR